MDKVYVILADGFEEVEAFAPVDILRRAGVPVETVGIKESRYVTSAHSVVVKADNLLRESDLLDAKMIVLPGGMPGAENLAACYRLGKALVAHDKRKGLIGAICAAPMVLGKLGLLDGLRATCYPGFEKYLTGAFYTGEKVVIDHNIITAYGPGAAFEFGYTLLSYFTDLNSVKRLRAGMMADD
ncbi:MAG: DJ-1/PfpI family protein [Prevotella sp.]|nr:DJ-1/PfpI family protein [Prevotella sp.]